MLKLFESVFLFRLGASGAFVKDITLQSAGGLESKFDCKIVLKLFGNVFFLCL